MNHGYKSDKPHKSHPPTGRGVRKPARASEGKPVSPTPLGDDRFQSLLAKANAFFAQAERDVVAERTAVITEIQTLMALCGLSVEDLQDAE